MGKAGKIELEAKAAEAGDSAALKHRSGLTQINVDYEQLKPDSFRLKRAFRYTG